MRPGTTVSRSAAGVDADHRPAGGLRLHGGDAELLDVGHDERRAPGVEPRAAPRSATRPRNSRLAAVARAQPGELGARAHDLDPPARRRPRPRSPPPARLWRTSSPTNSTWSPGSPIAKRSTSTGGWTMTASRPQKRRMRSRRDLRVGDVAGRRRGRPGGRRRGGGAAGRRAPGAAGPAPRPARAPARARRSGRASGSSRRARRRAACARRGRRRCCSTRRSRRRRRAGRRAAGPRTAAAGARKPRWRTPRRCSGEVGHARPAKRPSVPSSS